MDSIRTPGSSEQISIIITERVSPLLLLNPQHIFQFSATSTVDANVPSVTKAVVLYVDTLLLTDIKFTMPTTDELTTFISTTCILHKLTENKSIFLYRELISH